MATFTFPLDANGRAGVVTGIANDTDFLVPTLDVVGLQRLMTQAPLAAAGTYTSTSQDRLLGGMLESRLRFYVDSNVAGTLNVEESHDGTTWVLVGAAAAVAANTMLDSGWRTLNRRFWRARYVNGATAQTTFRLYETRDAVIDDVQITGAITLGAGAAAIGTVTAAQTAAASLRAALGVATTGGALPFQLTNVVAAAQAVKASAGTLYSIQAYNPSAAVAFVQVHNVAAPVLGTTVPLQSFAVGPGLAADVTLPAAGLQYSAAISVAATTTSRGATAPTAGLEVSGSYA